MTPAPDRDVECRRAATLLAFIQRRHLLVEVSPWIEAVIAGPYTAESERAVSALTSVLRSMKQEQRARLMADPDGPSAKDLAAWLSQHPVEQT